MFGKLEKKHVNLEKLINSLKSNQAIGYLLDNLYLPQLFSLDF